VYKCTKKVKQIFGSLWSESDVLEVPEKWGSAGYNTPLPGIKQPPLTP
jgi:hypothetical protein